MGGVNWNHGEPVKTMSWIIRHINKKHITGSSCIRVNYKLHVSDLQQHEPLSYKMPPHAGILFSSKMKNDEHSQHISQTLRDYFRCLWTQQESGGSQKEKKRSQLDKVVKDAIKHSGTSAICPIICVHPKGQYMNPIGFLE